MATKQAKLEIELTEIVSAIYTQFNLPTDKVTCKATPKLLQVFMHNGRVISTDVQPEWQEVIKKQVTRFKDKPQHENI